MMWFGLLSIAPDTVSLDRITQEVIYMPKVVTQPNILQWYMWHQEITAQNFTKLNPDT